QMTKTKSKIRKPKAGERNKDGTMRPKSGPYLPRGAAKIVKGNDKPPVPRFTNYPHLVGAGLEVLIDERQSLKHELEGTENRIRDINQRIESMMVGADVTVVTVHQWRVAVIATRSASRIVAEKLVELGVKVDVITRATVPGKEYNRVDVRMTALAKAAQP
ncbi:hypothetical protein LCGC14_2692000, partial [marine sediment metagenome]